MFNSKSYKPLGMPTLIPYLTVKDATLSIQFYQKAFNFNIDKIVYSKDKIPIYVEMSNKSGVMIMLCVENMFDSQYKAPMTQGITIPISFYVYCTNVDKLYKQAVNFGAITKLAPNNTSWGDRLCTILDIDGYEWSFATHLWEETDTKH